MLFDSPCSQTWYLKWLALIPYLRRCQDNFTVFANRRQWQLKYWRWTVRNYFDTRLFHHAIHNIMYIHKFEFEHQITIMYFFWVEEVLIEDMKFCFQKYGEKMERSGGGVWANSSSRRFGALSPRTSDDNNEYILNFLVSYSCYFIYNSFRAIL